MPTHLAKVELRVLLRGNTLDLEEGGVGMGVALSALIGPRGRVLRPMGLLVLSLSLSGLVALRGDVGVVDRTATSSKLSGPISPSSIKGDWPWHAMSPPS